MGKVKEASANEIAHEVVVKARTIQKYIKELTEFVEWTGPSFRDSTDKYKLIRKM